MVRGRTVRPALAGAFVRAAEAGDTDIEREWKKAKQPGTLGNARRGYTSAGTVAELGSAPPS